MFKKTRSAVVACLLSMPLLVQAAVLVEGRLQAAAGEPVVKARVLSFGAKPALSNTHGQFKLNFSKAKVGDKVLVTVDKPGWVVVNELEMTLPLTDKRVSLPTLLLAPKAEKQAVLETYLRSRAEAVVNEAYRVHRIKKMNGAELPHDEARELEQKRQEVLGHAERLVQQLLVWDPVSGDETLREVFRLYLAGQPAQAVALLHEDELFGGILAEDLSETEQRQVRINNGQALRLRGNLLLQQFMFTEADMAYKKAELINPNTFKNWIDNANFFYQQGDLELAASYYQKAVYFAGLEQQNTPERVSPDLADAEAGLATVFHALQRYEAARDGYLSALEQRRLLAARDARRYRVDLGPLLFNLGVLYQDLQQYDEARKVWQEAQGVFMEAATRDPVNYGPNLEVVKQALDSLPQ